MRAESGVFQVWRPASLLQEQVRAGDHVRRSAGAGGTPGVVQGVQLVRTGLQGKGRSVYTT